MEDSGIDTNDIDNNFSINHRRNDNEAVKSFSPYGMSRSQMKKLADSESETESEGSVEFDVRVELAKKKQTSTNSGEKKKYDNQNTKLLGATHEEKPVTAASPVTNEPSSSNGKAAGLSRGLRHKQTDVQPGVHGRQESASLLVDVPIDGSDTEDEIPLSWQRSGRSMREQLIKDGYNLDLESDNEDLDLIPPKHGYGAGGICSCSGDSCTIS